MSRLQQRLREMHSQQEAARKSGVRTEQFIQQLGDAGDALELAARVAEGVYRVRPQRPEETDAFRVGFATCGKEVALILRAMRKQTQPTEEELAACREQALDEAGGAVVLRAPATPEEPS